MPKYQFSCSTRSVSRCSENPGWYPGIRWLFLKLLLPCLLGEKYKGNVEAVYAFEAAMRSGIAVCASAYHIWIILFAHDI